MNGIFSPEVQTNTDACQAVGAERESKRIYCYEELGSVSDPNLSPCFCVPLKKARLKSKRVRKGDHYKGWVALSWNSSASGVFCCIYT